MRKSHILTIHLERGFLFLLFALIPIVYGCQQDKPALKKQSIIPTGNMQPKPNSLIEHAHDSLLLKATCCKGSPSRARALAAIK